MAIRLNASADRLLRTASLPGNLYTVCLWVYLVSDQNDYGIIFALGLDNGSDNYDIIGVSSDGTSLFSESSDNYGNYTTVDSGSDLVVGTWAHLAIVRASATSLQLYLNGVAAGAVNNRNMASRTAPSRMEIGGGWTSSDYYLADVRVDRIKIWDAALTAAEVASEVYRIEPVTWAGLHLWTPCNPGATERLSDWSGNGKTWTAGGTLTDEDPAPGIGWSLGSGWITDIPAAAAEQTITPTGIASAEAFGTAVMTPGAVTISPDGIASGEAFGTAVMTPGAVTISPDGIASGEAFGTAVLTPGAVTISPNGIASGEAFGTAVLTPGAVTISPNGIASGEAFGTAVVTPGAVTVSPDGIASGEAFGTAEMSSVTTINPNGIESGEAFGSAEVQPGAVTITPTGITSSEAFGTAALAPGAVTISPAGIVSGEAFGIAALTTGAVTITPSSIESMEAFGDAVVSYEVTTISAIGIASGEAFGITEIMSGAVTISPSGIGSAEAFGLAIVASLFIRRIALAGNFSVRQSVNASWPAPSLAGDFDLDGGDLRGDFDIGNDLDADFDISKGLDGSL